MMERAGIPTVFVRFHYCASLANWHPASGDVDRRELVPSLVKDANADRHCQ
jgi:hypothetical protein